MALQFFESVQGLQVKRDHDFSNLTLECDAVPVYPAASTRHIERNPGKIAVEIDVCDLEVANLVVHGKLTAKIDASVLDGGTSYSDYLFYNNATNCFDVGRLDIHLGSNAGLTTQGAAAVAIGASAGRTNQGASAVAIGNNTGNNLQGIAAVAIGNITAQTGQGTGGIAIGNQTAQQNQGVNAVAIGTAAGGIAQGLNSVAIGNGAGNTNMGGNSVAIGNGANASAGGVHTNAIVLNSSGTALNPAAANQLVVKTIASGILPQTSTAGLLPAGTVHPIGVPANLAFSHYLVYNPATGEIAMCPFAN